MGLTIPFLIGGLILFVHSIFQLSRAMAKLFTEKARILIEKRTRNLFISLLIGIVATMLLDSSSAVIILAIVFINAKTLTFKNAMGIIMGANIGTTFSSQLIAMDIAKFAYIPMCIGLVLYLFSKSPGMRLKGRAILYFGLLFFGLYIIQEAVSPLQDSNLFETWISQIEGNPISGALIGGLITLIIQSSGATVALTIILGKQGMISLAGGIAIMLGAELGTCSDTLIATIRGTRQAIKAGIFHLFFNFSTICIGLILFTPFVSLIANMSAKTPLNQQIANAHIFFNVAGVLVFLPLVKPVQRMLDRLLPEKTN